MKKLFAKFMLWALGWKIIGGFPDAPKYVGVIAPHTSIVDMFMGKFYNWIVDMEPKIIIKKEFFFFPLNLILKLWGGIPVDRKDAKGVVTQVVEMINKSDKFVLGITPEGTRSANPNWKTGFHRIATEAKIPVYLLFIDFKKKELGFLGEYKLTNNQEEDIKGIKRKYANIGAYHPEKFDLGDIS